MRTLSLLLFLAALTAAQTNECTGNKATIGYCETISYTDRTTTSSDPPSVAECNNACGGVLSDAGDWIVEFQGKPDGFRQNMVGSACAFSIGRAPGQPRDYGFSMHNQDIVDIIDEVNKRFAPLHGGRAAAEGIVRCEGFEATWYVT
ncbi:hypothetical protein CC86DRAFT_395301 [Ophiobolus disseminans]|uniref:Ecp2 effector protein-like domain-containing protein n=1 Tax=Ophiobolus disseminans TaxID=1469910 RepID=A0A6A6ZV13_9PLEO|nr:hypothetical protein CC86DRAFT_395301 [Ophiobolus disseminans]